MHGAVVATGEIALGAFDLDHARTGVGQAAAAVGRGHSLFKRHHQKAMEGAFGVG